MPWNCPRCVTHTDCATEFSLRTVLPNMGSPFNSFRSSHPSHRPNLYPGAAVLTWLTLFGGDYLYLISARRQSERRWRLLQNQISLKKGKLNPHQFVALQASDRFTPGQVESHLQGWGGKWQGISFADLHNFSVEAEDSGLLGFLASIFRPSRYILHLKSLPKK